MSRVFPRYSSSPLHRISRPASLKSVVTGKAALRAATSKRLWLCLDLYRLPFEVFAGHDRGNAPSSSVPVAVIEREDRGRRILIGNEPAARAGVRPGLSLNAALALAPGLLALERRPDLEQRMLGRLATRAGRFTPLVCLKPPQALLLEIGGSLKLFAGLEALLGQVAGSLAELEYSAIHAVAPTAQAAFWLARAGDESVITRIDALAGRLGELPITRLDWPARTLSGLTRLGVLTVRDCLRLPRDGFARRFGQTRLAELDCALGRRPEVLKLWTSPDQFNAELVLPAESFELDLLLAACRQLLDELGDYLLARQGGTEQFRLKLEHLNRAATRIALGLMQPGREPGHLFALLKERLMRTSLPAPVIALELSAGPVVRFDPVNEVLFPTPGIPRDTSRCAALELVERLKARLGSEAVCGLRLKAEHRPERNWQQVLMRQSPNYATSAPGPASGFPVRPLWLCAEPQRLGMDHGYPCFEGRLALISGPERIETGWWDDHDVTRDYYVARDRCGMRLWIFRERKGGQNWFLHGVFG